jgi:non-ribosomal peptide synthetase component E (peptide arylation enzyme)
MTPNRIDAPARFTDLVPYQLRREWAQQGYYADLDLFSLFDAQADRLAEETAIVDDEGSICFRDLRDLALRIAAGLAERGVGAGDVVGVQLPNSRLSCAVDLAVAALGAAVLPYPLGRGGREAGALLAGAQASCAIVAGVYRGHDYAAQAVQLMDRLPALRTVLSLTPSAYCESLGRLLRCPPATPVRTDPDSAARIMVSSGTEAEPKMVAFSHNALAAGLGAVIGEVLAPGQRPRSLWLVPLSAAFGSNALIGTLIMQGGTLVLQSRFEASAALGLVERHRPSHIFAVPTMLRMMLDHALTSASPGLPGPHAVIAGGARLDAGTAGEAELFFRCPVINTYGSSDGVHCMMSDDEQPRSGRPNPAIVMIRTVDEGLRDVPPGEVGEIIARGPFTPMCYVGSPELNERYRTPDGWVRTDDLGTLTVDGRLSVVDRRKEIVLRGGASISPAEVEQLIQQFPGVRDSACVGVPDPVMGERLCACVVLRDEATVLLEQIVTHLRECELEARKLPEHLVVLSALPYGPTGKVNRRRLRTIANEALNLGG